MRKKAPDPTQREIAEARQAIQTEWSEAERERRLRFDWQTSTRARGGQQHRPPLKKM